MSCAFSVELNNIHSTTMLAFSVLRKILVKPSCPRHNSFGSLRVEPQAASSKQTRAASKRLCCVRAFEVQSVRGCKKFT